MQRPRFVGSLLLCIGALAGCGRPEGPDVLLVTIDTLRADRLGCTGDGQARTPVIDRLAAEGTRLTDVSAPAPITLPSHATILTGRYPAAHGVHNNATFHMADAETTLAERARQQGFRTGAFVGAFVLARPFGLSQGFERYDDEMGGAGAIAPPPGAAAKGAKPSERRAGAVTDAALAWLRDLSGRERAFTWVHYFDPHADYDPPEGFRDLADAYRGEIAYVDAQLGRLLEGLRELGRLERTLVVVTSDHGEAFGEHGETQHGLFVYEPTVRVPLVVWWPGRVPAGRTLAHEASLADLAPTIAALLGWAPLRDANGQDLAPALLHGQAPAVREGVLVENWLPRLEFGWSELHALRRQGRKYIGAPRPELYDLRADPQEQDNAVARTPADAQALAARLRNTLEAVGATGRGSPGEVAALDVETVARLQSLGYVGAVHDDAVDAPAGARADPKDRLAEYLDTKAATRLVALGRYDEAVALIERVLAADPGNVWMRLQLGQAHLMRGRPDEARAVYGQILAGDPGHCEAMWRLGEIAMVADRDLVAAATHLRRSLDCDPRQPEVLGRLSAIESAQGRIPEARALLERAIALEPDDVDLRVRLGDLLARAGDVTASERAYRDALGRDARAVGAMVGLGQLDLGARRMDSARQWFERALEIAPDEPTANANLGALLLRAGDRAAAIERLRAALARDGSLAAARLTLAVALAQEGDLAGARAEAERFTAERPADPSAWIALARTSERMGQAEAARTAWDRAAAIDPTLRRPPTR